MRSEGMSLSTGLLLRGAIPRAALAAVLVVSATEALAAVPAAAIPPAAGAPPPPPPSCAPPCAPGQTCVSGVCMVPAAPTPAAPGPTAPPPPPPASGYAPPGAAAPPPPGYGPPPGYYQQPPPPSPPGAYRLPPAYQPMTAPPPPPQRRYRRLFLAMPFFGIADVMGAPSDNYDPGLRLGTLLGFRVTEALSLNGEFMVDVLNPDLPSGVTRGELYLDLAFSPLVHVKTSETVELVFGPKLGGFGYGASGSGSFSASGSGWLLGVNAGLFVAVNPFMSFGGLINYVYRNSTRYCTTVAGQQMCDPSPDGEAHLLGFNVAALF